jgi:hypothetical protein
MTRPPASSKLVLLEDRRGGAASPGANPLRRFRLARVRLESAIAGEKRFEYLKRIYD